MCSYITFLEGVSELAGGDLLYIWRLQCVCYTGSQIHNIVNSAIIVYFNLFGYYLFTNSCFRTRPRTECNNMYIIHTHYNNNNYDL